MHALITHCPHGVTGQEGKACTRACLQIGREEQGQGGGLMSAVLSFVTHCTHEVTGQEGEACTPTRLQEGGG